MAKNYPYVSTHYFSKNFAPQELVIEEKILTNTGSWHFRNESEFIFILDGTGRLEVNGLVLPLQKNQLLQLSPYHVSRLRSTDKEKLHIFRLYFSLGLLLIASANEKTYLTSMKELEQAFPLYELTEKKGDHLRDLCQDLLEEQQKGKKMENLNISLVSYIMYLCQKEKRQDYPYPKDFLGIHTLQYLQFHHQDPLTLPEVAQTFATTSEEVEMALKKLTGFSFLHLLNQVRIRNATALMTFPELKITTIGEICGFQSPSNFYKQFQLVHQTTPENYRHTLKKNQQLVAYDDAWDIVNYLLLHCQEDLTLASLSQRLHLESFQIHQLLKEKFQMSFKQILNQFRSQFAHALLMTTPFSPQEVQQKVGYKDYNTFVRNYKIYYQQTPQQTRKRKET